MFDATFWVAISFVLFVILILYKKVPKFVLNQIDIKISELKNKIREEIISANKKDRYLTEEDAQIVTNAPFLKVFHASVLRRGPFTDSLTTSVE